MRGLGVACLLALHAACSTSGTSEPSPGSGGAAGSAGGGGSAGSAGSGGSAADAGSEESGGQCQALDEPACLAAQQQYACTAYLGWKVPGGEKQFVICGEYCVGGATTSCAVDPSGTCWKFPDTCAPEGWTPVFECHLNAPPACTGALDGG